MFRFAKLCSVIAMVAMVLPFSAQEAVKVPAFTDNWSVGLDIGAVSPVTGGDFIGNFRPAFGINLDKQITPALALGFEAGWSVNSSRWHQRFHSSTAFDDSYVGLYGAIDLCRFARPTTLRPFSFGLIAGCGWGHTYLNSPKLDHNFFAAKAGLFFNFRVTPKFILALKPSFLWNLSDANNSQSSASFDCRHAIFALQAGLRYNFGPGFEVVPVYDMSQIDALNGEINLLRSQLDACNQQNEQANAELGELRVALEEANDRPEIIREVTVDNKMNTVLDVFFHVGSSEVSRDQMPNVERIADYLNNHAGSVVEIRGYASRDGNHESNLRLAQRRAEAVRDVLINKYKISPDRIFAKGNGIGEMFEEDSWNRVSVCTLEER